MVLTPFVSGLVAAYHSQRIHRGNINFGTRNASINALISKCEAIVRSYDMAMERRARDALLSKSSQKKSKFSEVALGSTPIIDKDGFTTVVHKRGRVAAASLDSVPTVSSHDSNECLFPFYDLTEANRQVPGQEQTQGPTPIPNFYKDNRKTKKFEGILNILLFL